MKEVPSCPLNPFPFGQSWFQQHIFPREAGMGGHRGRREDRERWLAKYLMVAWEIKANEQKEARRCDEDWTFPDIQRNGKRDWKMRATGRGSEEMGSQKADRPWHIMKPALGWPDSAEFGKREVVLRCKTLQSEGEVREHQKSKC